MYRSLALAASVLIAGCAGTEEAPAHDPVEPTGPVELGGSAQRATVAAGDEQVFEVSAPDAAIVGFSVEVERMSIEAAQVIVEVHSNGAVEQETFALNAIAGRGEVATGTLVVEAAPGMTVVVQGIEGESEVRVRAQEAIVPPGATPGNGTPAPGNATPAPENVTPYP